MMIALFMIIVIIPISVMARVTPSVSYRTHVQNMGWQDFVSEGAVSGTSGKGLRLEGIEVKLDNPGYDLGISYQTHIQNIGWEGDTARGWKSNGSMSGTEGLGYRLEGIQIKLTGSDASNFDIYYQVHAQNMGWLGWAKNGESSGTAGYGYRLEGIKIVIVPAGSGTPSGVVDKEDPFYENQAAPYAEILQEYRIAEDSGYADDIVWNLPNVNKELASSSYQTKLYYIVQDISGCENQIIRMYGSGGVDCHAKTFYKLSGKTCSTSQYILFERPCYFLTDANNNNVIISEYQANNIINSYIPRTDIDWIAL